MSKKHPSWMLEVPFFSITGPLNVRSFNILLTHVNNNNYLAGHLGQIMIYWSHMLNIISAKMGSSFSLYCAVKLTPEAI